MNFALQFGGGRVVDREDRFRAVGDLEREIAGLEAEAERVAAEVRDLVGEVPF